MKAEHIVGLLFSLFVGLIITIFVGTAVYTFYPSPKSPYDYSYNQPDKDYQSKDFRQKEKQYQKANKTYTQNVSGIVLVIAITTYASGYFIKSINHVVAEGMLFGGVLSSIYALIQHSASGGAFTQIDRIYNFAIVTVLLIMAILIVLKRFSSSKKLSN